MNLCSKINIPENWAENAPPPLFCLFIRDPACCHRPCGIPMVPILQIHTQISPIQISSLGYQLYQLFKILTYRDSTEHRIMVQVEAL